MGTSGQGHGRQESTASLLLRVRGGERGSRERLVARYLPILTRIAHGRLPRSARTLLDTDDLVLITLEKGLNHVETFEPRREGAFLAYLRQILLNRIRDEIRRSVRRPAETGMEADAPDPSRSPLEEVIGKEAVERYEAALRDLPEMLREAVMLRLEMGMSYADIAEALGGESPNAVRMSISRALSKMAKAMKGVRDDPR